MMSGSHGEAKYTVENIDGYTQILVTRDYPRKPLSNTAARVWSIISDFGAVKRMFPSLLSNHISYVDGSASQLNAVRFLTFLPPDPGKPLSSDNALADVIEKLVASDDTGRSITYIGLLGLPTSYRSVIALTGDDACTLTWKSTWLTDSPEDPFAKFMPRILCGGANEIAHHL